MNVPIHRSRFVVLLLASALLLSMVIPRASQAQTFDEQLSIITKQITTLQQQLAAAGGVSVVKGVATSTVPVIPACRLSFTKPWYTLGSQIALSWKSTGATSAKFITLPQDVGKDGLPLPSGTQAANGTASVQASVLGLPTVALQVTSATGHTSICSRTISILGADSTKTDKQLTPLYNRLKQLSVAGQALRDREQKLYQDTINNLTAMIETQQKIDALLGNLPDEEDEDGDEVEELIIKASPENPDASALVVNEEDDSDFHTILAFEIDSDDSTNDIEIESITVSVYTPNDIVGDVVQDAELVINGETITDWTWTRPDTKAANLIFDVDGDVVIEAGDAVTAELHLSFDGQNGHYEQSEPLYAKVAASSILAEGVDQLAGGQLSGSITGNTHKLMTEGVVVDQVQFELEDNDGEMGEFEVSFEVTAVGTDVYIPTTAARGLTKTHGVNFRMENAAGVVTNTAGTVSASVSPADSSGYIVVDEGTTQTIIVDVTMVPKIAGQYRLQLLQLNWAEGPKTPDRGYGFSPAAEFRTPFLSLIP